MWFDEVGEIAEVFRTSLPLSFLFFVPIIILISPVSPVGAAHDFSVYRMQQYDLQQTKYGCKNAIVNVEARPINANTYTRRCIVAQLHEMTNEKFKNMQEQNAGGLLVLLPSNMSRLSDKEKEHLLELEQDMMQEETVLPVYFTTETEELMEIYNDIKLATNSDQAASATEALLGAAWANGFQLVVNGPQSKSLPDYEIANIQGKLSGFGIEEQLPTIAIVAHYDSYGVAPSLAFGADSNGSGVVALLELARLFSKLYMNSRTHAKFNLLFLLSGAGKFNYQGTRKWIEDSLDASESSLLQDVQFVLCLDTLGSSNNLNLHVSKPPKEGSAAASFVKHLEEVKASFSPEVNFNVVHKKINLADDLLAWEHERFSIRRIQAFTLSHLDSHKHLERNSVIDTRERVDNQKLARNVKVLVEALARHVFDVQNQGNLEIFNGALDVQEESIGSWMDYLGTQSRAAQVLTKDHVIVAALEQALSRHLKDVKKVLSTADKRDPDFVFYSGAEFTMSAYNVKPAVFDLFLALAIAGYLGCLFLAGQHYSTVLMYVRKYTTPRKAKVQ
ncbi:unnamed protein product [Owenia fusiformis]|uniref:Nicalin n=1 Tax=Owenia fusiformis TaxID=6347 RepID=A0A8S4PU21_OWEFU|nr:unnamed protein product [Owenia fusiformis]